MPLVLILTLLVSSVFAPQVSRRRAVTRPRPEPAPVVVVTDDFRFGDRGWTAAFADYSPLNDNNGLMELDSGIRPLPPELGVSGTGLFIAGHNRSDDLFMFLTKKLTAADGVRPSQRYLVSFDLVFASNAGSNCVGIGGSPGESVFLKAGAAGHQPVVALNETGQYRVDLDKGNQSQGGREMSVAGNIANGASDCRGDAPFVTLGRRHTHPEPVAANSAGEIWLLVGTDSGFEGKTQLYYQSISATLNPAAH